MHRQVFTEPFLDDLKAQRKNRGLLRRLDRKIEEVLVNPERFKPLRAPMAGLRRVHVGPFVLTFEVRGESVVFLAFRHHDAVYR